MDKSKEKNRYLDRLAGWTGFNKSSIATNKKSFSAVKSSKINIFKKGANSDINSDVYKDGAKLRELAREGEKNSPFVRKYLNVMVNNIVGPTGFNLYVRGTDYFKEIIDGEIVYRSKLDINGNKACLTGFWEWAKKKNCDISQNYSLVEIEELAVRALFRDGESLIVLHKGGTELNKFGFALQLVDIERLDRTYFAINNTNGNRIIMGVELDNFNRKVAFYVKKMLVTNVPGLNQRLDGSLYERIDSKDAVYLYKATDGEQIRGYSPASAGLESLGQLEGYQEAELVNARASAGKMGFFISNDETVNPLDIADHENDQGEFIDEVQPGTFTVLPKGYTYKENSPDYPASFNTFVKTILRGVASAFNISYESLSNDRESVNFSSIRSGTIEDRENFKSYQNHIIENMLEKVYEEWLKCALLNKAIKLPDGQVIPFEKLEKFKNHVWRPRGFAWIDPGKDIAASTNAIKFGLSSRQRECEKLGVDFFEICDELSEEQKFAESKGIHLDNAENVLAELEKINSIPDEPIKKPV